MANRDMAARFLANPEQKLPPRPEREPKKTQPRAPMKRGRGPAKESENMKTLKKRWAFIKACMILSQRRTNGYTSCMECGAVDPLRLDLDHIQPTGQGGEWTPKNAQLLCRGPQTNDCHGRKHGQPEWSKSA